MLSAHTRPAQDSTRTARHALLPDTGPKSVCAVMPLAFEITYQAIEIDGRTLARDQADTVIARLGEALRIAQLRSKSELYIDNIAPEIRVGQSDTGQVPIIQDRILAHLRAACEEAGREMPTCRLDLRHGHFGIRCYLGRAKPTDYVYEQDLFSDNR